MAFLNKIVWFLISGLRPLFGTIQCRYTVTCTEYAKQQLEQHSFFVAAWKITKRFLSCNSFS